MDEVRLKKLQRYIGKRSQGQSDEQVMEHIEKEIAKYGITPEQWAKLLFPLCANAEHIFFLQLSQKANLEDMAETLISHTVRFRQNTMEKEQNQVAIVKHLLSYIPEKYKQEVMDKALGTSTWFAEYELTSYLIECGASLQMVSNGRSLLELAEHGKNQFEDDRVYNYIKERM
ncbi:MAG: hypothetical protein Q4A47_01405 [Erysipelotrichaceae bacterium]|nr:hypothetical protein [Erysipelotrichaceae bacterium]